MHTLYSIYEIRVHVLTQTIKLTVWVLRIHTMRSVIGTAAQYVEQGVCNGRASVCPSVCPSVPPFARRTPLLRVCCRAPGGQETSIDCCPALSSSGAAERQQMRAGGASLTDDVGSRIQTC